MRGSPQWSLSLRFPHHTLYTSLLSPIRATFPAHLSNLISIGNIFPIEFTFGVYVILEVNSGYSTK